MNFYRKKALLLNKRKCGILLHPTSMPSPYGTGDLGQGGVSK